MRPTYKTILAAAAILLLLAAACWGAAGFGQRSDGYYAPSKDPGAVLDYSVDWTAWLAGDTITVSDWTATTGITKGAASIDAAKKITTVWVSGGTAGTTYTFVNTITTTGGRTQKQSFKVEVKTR